MPKFTVYYSVFGKKLKTTVDANTKQEAQQKVQNAVKIIDCVPESMKEQDEIFNDLKKIFRV